MPSKRDKTKRWRWLLLLVIPLIGTGEHPEHLRMVRYRKQQIAELKASNAEIREEIERLKRAISDINAPRIFRSTS